MPDGALERLPYPLARPLQSLEGTDGEARFGALVDVHEGIVRTVALLGLSAYLRDGQSDAATDALIRDRLLRRPPSLGDWVDLADRLLQPAARGQREAAVPELAPFWAKGTGKLTPEASALAIR